MHLNLSSTLIYLTSITNTLVLVLKFIKLRIFIQKFDLKLLKNCPMKNVYSCFQIEKSYLTDPVQLVLNLKVRLKKSSIQHNSFSSSSSKKI